MAKPMDIPAIDDRVVLRGRAIFGRLVMLSGPKGLWARVDWETAGAPKLCHLYELARA